MENIILDNIPDDRKSGEIGEVDYETVLDVAMKVGIGILSSGGAVSRVETAVDRICSSYGVAEVSCAAFPSMVIASIKLKSGHEYSLLKRVTSISNNLALLEKYNQLSRDICSMKYPPDVALGMVTELITSKARNKWITMLGAGIVSAGFAIFFGGDFADVIPAFLVAFAMAGLNELLSTRSLNVYATLFLLSVFGGLLGISLCKLCVLCGLRCHGSFVIIGSIMTVIPGLMLTNAVRDLFTGDIMSGAFQIINALLLTAVIAAGYAVALLALKPITDFIIPEPRSGLEYYLYFMGSGTVGAMGICAYFNLKLKRLGWVMLATVPTLGLYLLMEYALPGQMFADILVTSLFAALLAEFLARVIKTPATVFIVPSIIAFVPGSSLYYAMEALVRGDFTQAGTSSLACLLTILGLAVGLCASALLFRLFIPVKSALGRKKNKNILRKD